MQSRLIKIYQQEGNQTKSRQFTSSQTGTRHTQSKIGFSQLSSRRWSFIFVMLKSNSAHLDIDTRGDRQFAQALRRTWHQYSGHPKLRS
jgi:hypothetical protein